MTKITHQEWVELGLWRHTLDYWLRGHGHPQVFVVNRKPPVFREGPSWYVICGAHNVYARRLGSFRTKAEANAVAVTLRLHG